MRNNKPYKIFSLDAEERERIENTELIAYICEGTESEIKEWFEIINIGGIKLNDQGETECDLFRTFRFCSPKGV